MSLIWDSSKINFDDSAEWILPWRIMRGIKGSTERMQQVYDCQDVNDLLKLPWVKDLKPCGPLVPFNQMGTLQPKIETILQVYGTYDDSTKIEAIDGVTNPFNWPNPDDKVCTFFVHDTPKHLNDGDTYDLNIPYVRTLKNSSWSQLISQDAVNYAAYINNNTSNQLEFQKDSDTDKRVSMKWFLGGYMYPWQGFNLTYGYKKKDGSTAIIEFGERDYTINGEEDFKGYSYTRCIVQNGKILRVVGYQDRETIWGGSFNWGLFNSGNPITNCLFDIKYNFWIFKNREDMVEYFQTGNYTKALNYELPTIPDYMDLNIDGNSEVSNASYTFIDPYPGLVYETAQRIEMHWSLAAATKNPYVTKDIYFDIPAKTHCFVLFTGKHLVLYCDNPTVTMTMVVNNAGAKIGELKKVATSGVIEIMDIFGVYEGYEPVNPYYKVSIKTPFVFIRQVYKTDSRDKLPKRGDPTYEIFQPGTSSAYVNPNDTGELASAHFLKYNSIAELKIAADKEKGITT